MPADNAIREFLRAHQEAETRFLAEIVKVPSDNPPGDCDRSAETVAKLLEGLGFARRAPQGSGRAGQGQRHDQRDQPDRAQDIRAGRPDDRAERPRRRRAAGNGLDPRPLRRRDRRRLDGRARRGGVEVGHRDLRLRHAGAGKERRGAERNGRAARHLRRGGRRRDRPALASGAGAVRSRISRSARASPTRSSPPTTAACISRSRFSAARPTPRGPSPASTRWKPPTRS